MSRASDVSVVRTRFRHELEAIKGQWIWLLSLGIVLIVIGTLALGMPLVASVATAFAFGILLVAGGIAQLVGAFWTRDWSGFFLMLLMGLLYLVVGGLFLRRPDTALVSLTLVLALSLIVSGLFRVVGSLVYRFPHWGWVLAGGAINLVLGAMILSEWPASALWVIGLFVGIDMIFNGWTWVVIALSLKSLPGASTSAHSATPSPV